MEASVLCRSGEEVDSSMAVVNDAETKEDFVYLRLLQNCLPWQFCKSLI